MFTGYIDESDLLNKQVINILRENLYPTNYSCITGSSDNEIVNIDESWEKREKEAKKLRKLLGFPDHPIIGIHPGF